MKFYFYLPKFTNLSGGIWFCHFLADKVKEQGHDVRKVLFGEQGEVLDEEDVAIYPEVVIGNPLGAKRVVRMLLNKDGLLAGRKIEKGENDFTFTYSRLYDKEAFLLHYPIVDLRAMNGTLTDFKDRALTLLFNGKNPDFVVPELLSTPLVMMTRQWPDIETTYKFLREAKVLYSSDCWTALLNQALILGCAPVISAWQGFSLEECLLSETPEVFELNKESDFTEANLFKKKLSFLKRVAEYRDNFPGRVGNLMKAIEKHFNSRILQVA